MKVSRRRLNRDLSALVRIPSWEECDTIGKHVLAQLRRAGMRSARRDKAGNVIATLGSGGPGLLLNAHLDTVPPGDFQGNPFSGKVSEGRLLGRGASDDKSGVAAILEIARHLKRRKLNRRVVVALSVWEESTSRGPNGAYEVAREADATQGIVLESTMSSGGRSMGVHPGCKGIMNLYVTVKGKAYHAATPHKGRNAVSRAARVIREFEKEFAASGMPRKTYRAWNRSISLSEVATITEIEARQGVNVVPGACELVANCRLLPDGDSAEIERRMRRLAGRLPRGWITWRTDRKVLGHVCEDRDLIATCRDAIRRAGLRPRCEIMTGRTDSTIFQHHGGIQSVVMGPGTSGTAHTRDEYVNVDSLVAGTRAVLAAVEGLVCT